MALIQGVKGKFPCPVCLVPTDHQSNLSEDYPLRTAYNTQKIFEEVNRTPLQRDKEVILKSYGLRPVQVGFI